MWARISFSRGKYFYLKALVGVQRNSRPTIFQYKYHPRVSSLSQSNFKPLSDRSNKVTFHWLWRWNAHLFHQSNSVFSKFKDQLLLWAGAGAFTRLPIDDIIPYFLYLNTVNAAIYLYWYLINKTDFLFSFKRLLQQHTLVLYYK